MSWRGGPRCPERGGQRPQPRYRGDRHASGRPRIGAQPCMQSSERPGKVGGAAICELRRRGLPVRAVVRDRGKATGLEEAGCEIAVADLHDARAVRAAIAGVSRVHVILPMNGRAPDVASQSGAGSSLRWHTSRRATLRSHPWRRISVPGFEARVTLGVKGAF